MQTDTPISPEQVREFVIAGHGNLARVQEMLAANPELLNLANEWRPGDTETAIQAASHVGNREIALYLLGQGAPMAIYTAAMLGDHAAVETILAEEPEAIHTRGAHGISLLSHAVWSGDVTLVSELYQRGATEGESMALTHAVAIRNLPMVQWLLEFGDPDLSWKNWQEKTALDMALGMDAAEIAGALRAYGAETS